MKKEFGGQSKKGGIYKITNLRNKKVYIGSAKFFQQRAFQHLSSLRNNKHQNKHLQASFLKHGEDAFLFEVVEVIEGDKLQRTTREREYLKKWYENWEKCYNFQRNPICKQGPWSSTPEETRKKMSLATKKRWKENETFRETIKKTQYKKGHVPFMKNRTHKKEANDKNRLAHLGKPFSETHKKNIKNALKGRVFSEEHKRKLRKQIEFVLENNDISYKFSSQIDAIKDLDLNGGHLNGLLTGKRKTHKGYRVKILTKYSSVD